MISYAYPAARRFKKVFDNPEYEVIGAEPYWNRFGVQGYCQCGRLGTRMFCVSQNRSDAPDNPKRLSRMFKDENVDPKQPVLFRNRFGRLAIQVVAWYGSHWYKVFTPDTPCTPDEFTELITRIRNEQTSRVEDLDWDEISRLVEKLRHFGFPEF